MHLLVTALLGCRPDPGSPPSTGTALPAGTFAEIAEALGYEVQQGAVVRIDDRDCCDPSAACWFSNPEAPYLGYALPPAPGEEGADSGSDLVQNYRLRGDEAVVLIGEVPPEAAYWGSSSFLATRQVGAQLTAPRGATGPSVNNQAVALSPGETYAVVTTLDAAVEREVVRWLEASGVASAAIHADRIPFDLVRSGLSDQADTFAHVLRLAGFADPAAGEAFLADPGARLFRLTPAEATSPAEPHPIAAMPARGAGTNELDWVIAVAAIGDAVRARFDDRPTLEVQITPLWVEPYACIERGSCSFDSSDQYFGATIPFGLSDDEVVVAYGVNHQRSGKAAYHGLSVHEIDNLLEIASVDPQAMVGSARGWVDPSVGAVDDLYAVAFSRSCDGLPAPCIEIGGGCPGADPGELMTLAVRAFLEPATGTGPLASELVIDRAIKVFAPRPPTTGDTAADTGATDTASPVR